MASRFTRRDIAIINAALALYEVEHEDGEPDAEQDPAGHSAWRNEHDAIYGARVKVQTRKGWDGLT